jgi:hypothetical protein
MLAMLLPAMLLLSSATAPSRVGSGGNGASSTAVFRSVGATAGAVAVAAIGAVILPFPSSTPSRPFSFSCDTSLDLLLSLASLVACVFVVSASTGMLLRLPRIFLVTYWPGLLEASTICFPLSANASDVTPCATDIDSLAVCVRGDDFSFHEPPYQLFLPEPFGTVSLVLVVESLVAVVALTLALAGSVSPCVARFCATDNDWLRSAGACELRRDFLR